MRIVRTLLFVLLLFSAVFFGALIWSRSHGKRFTAIHPGDTQASVEARVGPSTRIVACASLPEPPDNCTRVLVYEGPLTSVMPEFWLISLDASGRVLRVFHTTRA